MFICPCRSYLIENLRNADGEIVKSYDNRAFVRTMDKLGYKHQGFPVGYDSMSQIRWLSVLDLKDKTEDQLLKKWIIKRDVILKKHMILVSKLKR